MWWQVINTQSKNKFIQSRFHAFSTRNTLIQLYTKCKFACSKGRLKVSWSTYITIQFSTRISFLLPYLRYNVDLRSYSTILVYPFYLNIFLFLICSLHPSLKVELWISSSLWYCVWCLIYDQNIFTHFYNNFTCQTNIIICVLLSVIRSNKNTSRCFLIIWTPIL